jgi:hypothetical protein
MKPADQTPPDRWLPLDEVFVRVKRYVGDSRFAVRDIKQALVDGRVAARERSLTHTGNSTTRELSAAFWQPPTILRVNDGSDHVVVRTKRKDDQLQPAPYYSYSLRPSDVEKVWPENKETATADENPSRKSAAGAKGDYDWETILIEAARYMYETGVPKSLNHLCRHIEDWCGDDPPGETQLKRHLRPLFQELKKADSK